MTARGLQCAVWSETFPTPLSREHIEGRSIMVAVSPFFATTRLLNEIRTVRAQSEDARHDAPPKKQDETSRAAQPRRTPK